MEDASPFQPSRKDDEDRDAIVGNADVKNKGKR